MLGPGLTDIKKRMGAIDSFRCECNRMCPAALPSDQTIFAILGDR